MRPALLALALLAATSAHAQQAETFDFKGVSLGISLQRMREIRADDQHLQNASVVCTGDPQVGPASHLQVHLTAEEEAAGLRRCAYYDPPRYPGFSNLAHLGIGSEYIATDYDFDFFPDPVSGEHRLFRIALVTNVGARHFVYPALTAKFGPPNETSAEPTQNQFGAHFDRAVTRWSRPGATLTVTAPSGRSDRMSIVYQLTDLARHAQAAVRDARAHGPNQM